MLETGISFMWRKGKKKKEKKDRSGDGRQMPSDQMMGKIDVSQFAILRLIISLDLGACAMLFVVIFGHLFYWLRIIMWFEE